ncbi:hypothetical protein PM10SUCC1_29220 [Propionigenium maris DSM 9537]|uniref:Uncharacterized protein n=1 Tax=Propionigenium maris DSM 9537 TaxID=1123000 RepID=A0A9W6LP75_9FUSO|nr:hypothetical protein PM10SUCC1_29220 [Propionigenium maris DSM 9537]
MTRICRKLRFLITELMKDRKATPFTQATIENFKYRPKWVVKTFTSNNGKELKES